MTPLKNAQAAKSYYEKDNYYAKDSEEAAKLSHWWGKGAEKLGLKGYVKVEEFEKLLDGILPSGQRLGRTAAKDNVHRPGYDLTFSAPKSVSLLAEIGGDHRIYAAHDKAVADAMAYIEKNAIKTRASRDGEIVFERVDNLVVAMFRHDTSREQDPSTHTHCVVLNMVEREDGKWRSISSEALFQHKMVAGLVYRSALAIELQKLGFDIEQTHSDGRFELKDFSPDVIQHFSQRRQQIEERLEKEGWEGGKASAKVTLDTRKRKKDIERDSLMGLWQKRSTEVNFNPEGLITNAKIKAKQQPFSLKNPADVAKEAVQYAAAHLGEREAVFSEKDLLREGLAHALGQTTLEHIEKALHQAMQNGSLIAVDSEHWTTLAALKLEEDNIRLMKEGQEKSLPMASKETVQAFIAAQEETMARKYTPGQREAIELILTNADKTIGIQGSAGTGKTTMLRAVREFALNMNYELLGLAPTKNAALELQDKTDITCITLQKYLIEAAKKNNHAQQKPLLLILDEASMASSRQVNQLLQILRQPNIRLAMIGDVKQLAAIEAGKPFYQLQKAGMKTARMEEIVRQKSAVLKQAIYAAIKGNIKEALQKVDITEVGNKAERLKRIIDEYLSYSPSGRERTLVLVPANEDRITVNQGIREGLKKENLLTGTEIETTTLVSRGFSKIYRSRVTNYANGDIVRFNKSYKALGIKAGDYWEVTTINRATNEMQLKHLTSNKTFTWNPAMVGGRREGAIEVYTKEARTLMAGDKIRWLRNQGEDFINAQTADVLRVEGHFAEVKLHNQKIVTLNLNQAENQHWDYAFAYTLHAKQGGENVRVIGHIESFRKKLSTQQALYVAISRAEYNVRLIVDNLEECMKTIEQHTGEKSSALEALKPTNADKNWQSVQREDLIDDKDWHQQQTKTRKTKWQKTLSPSHSQKVAKQWDIAGLQQRLAEQAKPLALQLLGPPNPKLSSSTNLRYGKKGSLSIPIAGKHIGTWHSFESGEKGNLIQLIQHVTGLSFKEALHYAGQYLGISPETSLLNNITSTKITPKEKSTELSQDDHKAIARAQKLEKESLPIQGTLAERYLREHRAIQCELPDTFRYHPKVAYYHINEETGKIKKKEFFPALICVAKDQTQQTQAVQVIYLDPKTANKAHLDIPKRTYGRVSLGSAVTINPGQSNVLIAEGPETGLSLAQAYPDATVMVALSASNFNNVKLLPEQKTLTICMDNDGHNPMSQNAVTTAAKTHTEQGCTVYLAQPNEIKQDFNDVLKQQGTEAIKQQVDSAMLFQMPTSEIVEKTIAFDTTDTKEMAEWISLNEQNKHPELTADDFFESPELEQSLMENAAELDAIKEASIELNKTDIDQFMKQENQAIYQSFEDDFDMQI